MSQAGSKSELSTPSGNGPYSGITHAEGLRPPVFVVTVLLVFVADQISKAWMVRTMYLGESRPIIGQAFRLTLTHNTGGAWGYLPRGNGVFTAFAAVAVVALILAYQRVGRHDLQVGAAFALAMGGAIGNLADRVRLGFVIDFFDARIIHWPVFNMADSAISISILLLVWHCLRSKEVRYPNVSAAEVSGVRPDTQP